MGEPSAAPGPHGAVGQPDPVDLFRQYQDGLRHEGGLMLARLTALLSSQSFLLIAYAGSMSSANGRWQLPLTLVLPPVLALLGLVLAAEGLAGILAARAAGHRWSQRLDALIEAHPELSLYTNGADRHWTRHTRHAGELFASRSPVIFMVAWAWFLVLPFAMRRWG